MSAKSGKKSFVGTEENTRILKLIKFVFTGKNALSFYEKMPIFTLRYSMPIEYTFQFWARKSDIYVVILDFGKSLKCSKVSQGE